MASKGVLAAASLTAVLGGLLAFGPAADTRESVSWGTSGIHAGTLWDIVSTCIDRDGRAPDAPFCECAAFVHSCCGDRATPNDAVVWARTAQFVAIRDLKMCGCDAAFVAGLALPRTRVTGIEDPARPEGIWRFAWGVARGRIPDELEIGLVINPIQGKRMSNSTRPEPRRWHESATDGQPGALVACRA